jgi:regulator of sigma E protease
VTLTLRDGRSVALAPGMERYVDESTGEEMQRPLLGIGADERVLTRPAYGAREVPFRRGVLELASLAWGQVVEVVRQTALGIARIVTGELSPRNVGSLITIAMAASSAAEAGLGPFLYVMAVLSVNLGLLNLLPIPVLDGGHIAAAVVEGVTRRPISLRVRELANLVGLILLVTLMVFALRNDILRLLSAPPGSG